jgi:hypothetical protein
MSEHMDDLARTVAERTTRRSAVAGLGSLVIGALGVVGIGQSAEAKKNNNKCQRCKKQCRKNNNKRGKKNKTNCNKKCNNKCKNN